MKKMIAKSTWIGLGISVMVLLLSVALGALLQYKNLLSTQAETIYLTGCCAVAICCGCLVGTWRKGQKLPHSMVVCTMFYLLLWIVTLSTEERAAFDGEALRNTIAIWGSGVLTSLISPRKQRFHKTTKGSRSVNKKRKHAVT